MFRSIAAGTKREETTFDGVEGITLLTDTAKKNEEKLATKQVAAVADTPEHRRRERQQEAGYRF